MTHFRDEYARARAGRSHRGLGGRSGEACRRCPLHHERAVVRVSVFWRPTGWLTVRDWLSMLLSWMLARNVPHLDGSVIRGLPRQSVVHLFQDPGRQKTQHAPDILILYEFSLALWLRLAYVPRVNEYVLVLGTDRLDRRWMVGRGLAVARSRLPHDGYLCLQLCFDFLTCCGRDVHPQFRLDCVCREHAEWQSSTRKKMFTGCRRSQGWAGWAPGPRSPGWWRVGDRRPHRSREPQADRGATLSLMLPVAGDAVANVGTA